MNVSMVEIDLQRFNQMLDTARCSTTGQAYLLVDEALENELDGDWIQGPT